jgi:hypothetical protein
MPARRSPLSLPCIKNASEGSESGRFGQYRSGTRHRENPYYLGLFSSHTERPGPLGGTSNPAGATNKILQRFLRFYGRRGCHTVAVRPPIGSHSPLGLTTRRLFY